MHSINETLPKVILHISKHSSKNYLRSRNALSLVLWYFFKSRAYFLTSRTFSDWHIYFINITYKTNSVKSKYPKTYILIWQIFDLHNLGLHTVYSIFLKCMYLSFLLVIFEYSISLCYLFVSKTIGHATEMWKSNRHISGDKNWTNNMSLPENKSNLPRNVPTLFIIVAQYYTVI